MDQVPPGEEWLHEIKYDGYRITCRIDTAKGGAHFYTRKGYDFTDRLPKLREAVARLPLTLAWLDGEIVVFSPQGRSDFHALQNAFKHGSDRNVVYLVFDLMNYQGYDLRSAPLSERKGLLADLIPGMEEVRYVEHVVGHGDEFFRAACCERLEGIVSKRVDAEYLSQRSRSWLKVKCNQRQEFVVGGDTESGAGRPCGSLLALRTLQRYEQPAPPFVNQGRGTMWWSRCNLQPPGR